MFIFIGPITCGLLYSPTAMDLKGSISYPEHQVIEGKPLLQFTGWGLDEIDLDLYVHADFGNPPQMVWDDLYLLMCAHEAVPISHGSGLYQGTFVIREMQRTTSYAAADGTLFAFEAKIKLVEFVDINPLETRKEAKKKTAKAKKPVTKSVKKKKAKATPAPDTKAITRQP
jgi:phage protein U